MSTTMGELWPLYRCDTNEEVPAFLESDLSTIGDVLCKYFSHTEQKAANPGGCGVMLIRQVHITGVKYSGKEVNERLEEVAEESYGLIHGWREQVYVEENVNWREVLQPYAVSDVMLLSGLPATRIYEIKRGTGPHGKTQVALLKAVRALSNNPGKYEQWRN